MKLNYLITENYDEMSNKTAEIIIEIINKNPCGLYCFAGGDTPVRTLQIIADACKRGVVDLNNAKFIELDEWVGIDPLNEGSCISYLKRNLFHIIHVPESNIHIFNSKSKDLNAECKSADAFVDSNGGLTLALLGVGVNGHLGFNEPYTVADSKAHVVDLDEVTKEVGKKYFNGKESKSQGITLGISQLMNAKNLIIQASGNKKRDAILKVLQGEVRNDCPVSHMWTHENPYLIIDKDVLGSQGGN